MVTSVTHSPEFVESGVEFGAGPSRFHPSVLGQSFPVTEKWQIIGGISRVIKLNRIQVQCEHDKYHGISRCPNSSITTMFSLSSLPRPTKTYHTEPYERILKHHKFDGSGKTVLVTGGAGGVGLAISKAFLETGARVAIVSRSAEKAKGEIDAMMFQGDISDTERMKEILKELGTVDVLVLNAAVAHRRALPTELTIDEFKNAFDVNVISSFNILQAYFAMPGPKTVINISSAVGSLMASHRIAYGASKAAGAMVMQSFAAEFKDHKVFSFHPGSFYTPGVAQNVPKHMIKWEDERLPAYFAVWLAGDDSKFLHGRHLWANWDVTELEEMKERIEKDPNFLTIGQVM